MIVYHAAQKADPYRSLCAEAYDAYCLLDPIDLWERLVEDRKNKTSYFQFRMSGRYETGWMSIEDIDKELLLFKAWVNQEYEADQS